MKTTREKDLEQALKIAKDALERAPHKHRIDFDPYWQWQDTIAQPAIKAIEHALL